MIDSSKLRTLLWLIFFIGLGCRVESEPDRQRSLETGMMTPRLVSSGYVPAKVLVGYYSLSGNTKKMAAAVAEGANRVKGVTVLKKPVADITKSDLDSAQGLILGCPTHFANIPGKMKTIIDHWAWKLRVNLTNKIGGAFSTGGNFTGGKEHVVISLLLYMLNNRMIIVGPIYKQGDGGWGEIGASAATGVGDGGISEVELADARKLGERVGRVVKNGTGLFTHSNTVTIEPEASSSEIKRKH